MGRPDDAADEFIGFIVPLPLGAEGRSRARPEGTLQGTLGRERSGGKSALNAERGGSEPSRGAQPVPSNYRPGRGSPGLPRPPSSPKKSVPSAAAAAAPPPAA